MDLPRRKKVEVAFLQETHLLEKDVAIVQNTFYHVTASSLDLKKKRGVIILSKSSFQCIDQGDIQRGDLFLEKHELMGPK